MLYEHQTVGASWLAARPKAYLGDRPGLGKTRTILAGLKERGVEKALIVCPAIVQTHWWSEINALDMADRVHAVASYDWIVKAGLEKMAYLTVREKIDALILDEAHYCKHSTSQRSQILLGKNGYSRRVDNVWLASGTPMPKNPAEMWTQICTLAPQLLIDHGLRTYEQWVARFCVTRDTFVRGQHVEKVVDVQNVEELKEILDVVMLRRETGADIPPIWWQTLRLDTSANHDIPDDWGCLNLPEGTLEEIADEPHIARMRRRIGELKVAPVAEMLRGQLADSAEKIVVFAHHTSVLRNLETALRSYGVAFIDGSTPQGRRDLELSRFQDDPRCRVFIGQNQACGTGFDGLQYASSRAVLVEPSWTASENEQLGKRVARTGQTGSCIVQFVALANTLDESIVAQNLRETKMAAKVGV